MGQEFKYWGKLPFALRFSIFCAIMIVWAAVSNNLIYSTKLDPGSDVAQWSLAAAAALIGLLLAGGFLYFIGDKDRTSVEDKRGRIINYEKFFLLFYAAFIFFINLWP